MNTIARGLMFVVMAVGLVVLVIAVGRRPRASDPSSDLVEGLTQAGNGHGNGRQQEAYEEI